MKCLLPITNKPIKNNQALKKIVEDMLVNIGYKRVGADIENKPAQSYSRDTVVGTNVFGRPFKIDFDIVDSAGETLYIEVRWQQVSGSVEEKFPFLSHNLINLKEPTVLILDGGGYSKGAYDWLKNSFINTNVTLCSIAEFQASINDNTFL